MPDPKNPDLTDPQTFQESLSEALRLLNSAYEQIEAVDRQALPPQDQIKVHQLRKGISTQKLLALKILQGVKKRETPTTR